MPEGLITRGEDGVVPSVRTEDFYHSSRSQRGKFSLLLFFFLFYSGPQRIG